MESLLYFESKLDEIITYIENLKNEDRKPTYDISEQNEENFSKPIIDGEFTEPPFPIIPSPKKIGKYDPTSDDKKRELGNKAESEVYASLVKEYGEEYVDWVSKRDDTLGYDIKYKDKKNEWKYVEVKKVSGRYFYLSKNEKGFADKNRINYELFLVYDDLIKRFDRIDFSDSDSFIIEIDKYKIYI